MTLGMSALNGMDMCIRPQPTPKAQETGQKQRPKECPKWRKGKNTVAWCLLHMAFVHSTHELTAPCEETWTGACWALFQHRMGEEAYEDSPLAEELLVVEGG